MNRRLLVVMGTVAAAHLAVLGIGAARYVEPPKPQVETVHVLTGRVSDGEFVASGYALARIRSRTAGPLVCDGASR